MNIVKTTTRVLGFLCAAWVFCGGLQAQGINHLERALVKAKTVPERLDALKMLIDSSMTQDLARAADYVEQLQGEAKRAKSGYHLGFVEEKRGLLSYKGSRLDSARVQYKRAYDHYWRAGSKEEALLVYTRIGIMYSLEGRFGDAARIYGNVIAHSDKTTKVHAFLHNQRGTLYHYQNNVDSASYHYAKSVARYTELDDTLGLLRPMYNHAALMANNGQVSEAKRMLYRIKDIQERRKAWEDANYTYGMLVELLHREGNYAEAMGYAEKQYNYAHALKDTLQIMQTLTIFGKLVRDSDDPAASIPYLEKALAIAKKGGILQNQVLNYQFLGNAYLAMKQYDKAEAYYKVSLDLEDKQQARGLASGSAAGLGQVYYHAGRLQEAKYWIQKALLDMKNNPNDSELSLCHAVLANIHLAEKQPQLAIASAKEAIATLEDTYTNWALQINNILYNANKELGNYQAALQYHEQYKQLSDTLYNVEKVKAETKQFKDFEFELEKQQLAAERQQAELLLTAQARQNGIIAVGIGALALLGFGFFWNTRRNNQIISFKNTQLEQLNATKDRIFAIIGHDMRKPALAFRGMTQKINYLLQKQDYPRLTALGNQLEETAYSLTTVTDNLLNWALLQKDIAGYQPQPVVLHQVAEELNAIFAAAARNKNITLSILSDTPAQQQVFADPLALRTILRNLIDNAIKYTPEDGTVRVTATAEGEWVNIGVQDSGIGIPEAEQKDLFVIRNDKSRPGTAGEKGTGLGLHLAHELTKLNKGVLTLHTRMGQGTRFELQLPAGG